MGVIKGNTRSLDNGSNGSFQALGPLFWELNQDDSMLGFM